MYGFNKVCYYKSIAFIRSPISLLNDLFPNEIYYTFTTIQRRRYPTIFECVVQTPLGSGKSRGPSKEEAKHQAASKLITYLIRSYCPNTNVVRHINKFVIQENPSFLFEYKTIKSRRRNRSQQITNFDDYEDLSSSSNSDYRNRHSCRLQHYSNKEGGRSRSRSRSRSRARSTSRSTNALRFERDQDFVSKLEEICVSNQVALPNYAYKGVRSNGKFGVTATHELIAAEFQGSGFTLHEAKQAAAAALLEFLFTD